MNQWFLNYTQEERAHLKQMIRKIYFEKRVDVLQTSQKVRALELSNIFLKYVVKPSFYREDITTIKDVFLYAEWVINHWGEIQDEAAKEEIKIAFLDDKFIEKIKELKIRIERIKGKPVNENLLDTRYKELLKMGKTPDKIKLEKLNKSTIGNAIKYIESIEGAILS